MMEQQKKLLSLEFDSEEMVFLGYLLSIKQLQLLKSQGIPLRWHPLGATYTLVEHEGRARTLLDAQGEGIP